MGALFYGHLSYRGVVSLVEVRRSCRSTRLLIRITALIQSIQSCLEVSNPLTDETQDLVVELDYSRLEITDDILRKLPILDVADQDLVVLGTVFGLARLVERGRASSRRGLKRLRRRLSSNHRYYLLSSSLRQLLRLPRYQSSQRFPYRRSYPGRTGCNAAPVPQSQEPYQM